MNLLDRCIFCLLFSIHLFPFFTLQTSAIAEYERSFESDVFDNYYSQLRSFIHAQENLQPASSFHHFFEQDIYQTAKTKRAFHTAFLTRLRALLASSDSQRSFSNHLCFWMYTQPKLLDSYWRFLHTFRAPAPSLNGQVEAFSSKINLYYHLIQKEEELTGYYPSTPPIRDSHYNGQLPSVFYRISKTAFLHMARPLAENTTQRQINIVPEFKAYLDYLRQQGQTHLYINLMDRQGKEKRLTEVIEQLEEDESFGSTISIITLDKNSSFYWQKESNRALSSAQKFKKAFMDKLFAPSSISQFKWPKKLPETEWKQTCEQLLSAIHHDYFAERPTLSREERQQFIELMLVKIVDKAIAHMQPDYCNITCKHSIDRGPSLLAIFYAHHVLHFQRRWTQVDEKMILTILFAPALLSHNRSPHHDRLERFNQTLQRFIKFSSLQKPNKLQ